MTKTLENFTKKLKKLENYFILREEDEYFIVGTKIIIKEHKEVHTTFSTYTSNLDRELPVFFMLYFGQSSNIHDKFIKNNLPIFNWNSTNSNSSNDKIKLLLDEFINKTFNN